MVVVEEDRHRCTVVDNNSSRSHNNKLEEEEVVVVVDSSVERVQRVRPAGGYLTVDSNPSNPSNPAQDYSEGRAQPREGRGYLRNHSLSSSKQEEVGVYLAVVEGEEASLEPSSHNNSSKPGQGYSISVALLPRPSPSSKVGVSLASSSHSSSSNHSSVLVGFRCRGG